MQYYSEYVLGWDGLGNKKADKGTITHKILEICALSKKATQDGIKEINDDAIGKVITDNYDPEYLSSIGTRVYQFYTNKFDYHVGRNAWTDKDHKDCLSWAWKVLKYKDGLFDPCKRNVVAAEPHFDFELPFQWAEYDYPQHNIKGRLALKGTIDLITDLGDGVYEVVDWKGLPLNTLLPTPTGFTTMQNVKIGDILFDQYGEQCKVVGKSNIKTKQCYRITFDDTTSVVCDDEHLWKLSSGDTVEVKELRAGDTINVCKPLNCESGPLPIHPYVLGMWLGDSRNRKALENDRHDKTYNATSHFASQLSDLDLLNNKYIPNIYLRASIDDRLDLLKGLMCSEGHITRTNQWVVFTTYNVMLLNDVRELVMSLGSKPEDRGVDSIAFRLVDINPVLNNTRTIVSVEESIAQKTQCIAVDSTDNTYLCTENMIPTHNTGRRIDWATGKEKTQASLFFDPQLRLYHYACKHMYPDISTFIITIYFINTGGPFTVHFQDSDLEKTEELIRKRFEAIRDTKEPQIIRRLNPQQGWFCKRLCYAGKTTFEDTHIKPQTERRMGQYTKYGEVMNKCEQMRYMIKKKGIEWVTDHYTHPDHVHGEYGEGGGKIQEKT